MVKKNISILLFLILLFATISSEAEESRWEPWSQEIFARASKEQKFVILDLEAVWCHWCHVMEETTYQNPKVQKLLDEKFISVRADQEAYPDLAARYEDWGWPATIVFAADGTEIIKRRGYIPPGAMVSLLEAIIKDPTPGPSVMAEPTGEPVGQSFLPAKNKKTLEAEHDSLYDEKFGGWGERHKLIDMANMEYALTRVFDGDKKEEIRARRTLDEALNLLDPEWGGFYQYSDELNWKSPHFEKIMPIQSGYMRIYAVSYALWKDVRYLMAAQAIFRYVKDFWTSPEGAFYTSQDADVGSDFLGNKFYSLGDKDRRALGRMPRIDTHIYSRENGWMISGLLSLYEVTGDGDYLDAGTRAAEWILGNRSRAEGGFSHAGKDNAGPFLEDTLSMGQAFLELYAATADQKWLAQSEKAALFIDETFRHKEAGYLMFQPKSATGVFAKPVRQLEAQIALARWTNLLYHYTGHSEYRSMAEHAMKYLTAPVLLDSRGFLAGILVADRELSTEPAHLTVVGLKSDLVAQTLYRAALTFPAFYKRIEWWDKTKGNLPRGDVTYPDLGKPAAFVCANQSCSLPYDEPVRLLKAIENHRAAKANKDSS